MRFRGGYWPGWGRAAFSLVVAGLLLQGCIGMDTTIRFEANGSGTATVVYRVSQLVTKLGTAEGEQGRVPLPVSDADFRQAIGEVQGVSLVGDVRRTEDEDDVRLAATLRFDKVESLTQMRGFESMPATLTQQGGSWTYRQVISDGTPDGQVADPETLEMVRSVFGDYRLTFVIEAPSPVKTASLGAVSGRTVTYEVEVADLLSMSEGAVLEVVW